MYNHMMKLHGYMKDLIKPITVGVYILCRIKENMFLGVGGGGGLASLRRRELLVALVHQRFTLHSAVNLFLHLVQ